MGELLTPTHLMVIAIVAFVLFGAKRLPELGKGLGEGFRGFKDGIMALTKSPDQPRANATAARQETLSEFGDLSELSGS